MELYIVLAIMAFMIVGFVWNKWPFGLTAMTCCVLLALTNVYPIDKAFAGFTNKNVILVAPMFVLSAAFGRTSLLRKIQDKMVVLKGKSGFVLLVALYAVVIALACFLPTTAEMTLMLMFLVSLGNTGDITPSRMTIPILGMLSMWGTKLPIGMGAAAYATYNVYYEGMVTNEGQLLGFLDQFKVAIIPCILVTIYCLFAYKLMPNTSFDETKLKEQKKQEALPKTKENIIYAVFVIVMGSLFFNSALGNMMYIIPAVGILVLTFTKAISVKELVAGLTSDPVWMMVGVLVMADALGSTGAGDLIGQIILKILGGNPSGLFVLFVFAIVTVIMTTFMSNAATKNVLIPIAASTCIAAGWDPRGVVLIVAICSNIAIAFPSGSPACGIAFASGGYKVSSTLKFTLPFIAIALVSTVLCADFFFPIG